MHRLLALPLLLGACGIQEEIHMQTVRDLEKCKQDLSVARTDLARVSADLEVARTRPVPEHEHPGQPSTQERAELERARDAAQKRAAQGKQLADQLAPLVQAGTLRVAQRKGRIAVELPEKLLFEPGRAELKPDAAKTLAQVAAALRDLPDRELLVAGHTAAAPLGKGSKFRSNWELSTTRAIAVVQFLQNQGVDPRRMGAVGFSEFDPLEPGAESGQAAAGRIEIILVPGASELPLPTGGS